MKTLKLFNEEAVAETFIIFGNHLHASISLRKLAAEEPLAKSPFFKFDIVLETKQMAERSNEIKLRISILSKYFYIPYSPLLAIFFFNKTSVFRC